MKTLVIVCLSFILAPRTHGQAMADMPSELQKVFNYILKTEYLELFADSSEMHHPRTVDWAITNIDGDNKKEVFLLINPYFAETAPIQIYQIGEDGVVTRVKEALAPGQPVVRGENQLSGHIGGMGMDMTLQGQSTLQRKRKFVEASMKHGMTVVEFPDFFHGDHRASLGGGYVDLRHTKRVFKEPSCSPVQLAKPSSLQVGKIKGKQGNVLAVVVDKEIWLYRISRVTQDGFLEKKIATIKLPKDFVRFDRTAEYFRYTNRLQQTRELVINATF